MTDTRARERTEVEGGPRRRRGGVATWACAPGFPPSTIFPFTPPERFGTRNVNEFQALMYRPLYWFGRDGELAVDFDLSIGEPPEWSDDGRTVTIAVKPWKWSNGETICADNVLFWVNMMVVKGDRYGAYVPGYFPDNLTSYGKVTDDTVRFTFDRSYSKRWVLMNQLSTITPMPRAWDRTDAGPANATEDLGDVERVYAYLMSENGGVTDEDNTERTRWPDSPVWSVVSGPWRLKSFAIDGTVTFVPNEHYSGPNPPYLDEFRQVPITSDEEQYRMLEAGPRGPGAIQVGYLPHSFTTGQTTDPTSTSGNPVRSGYRLVPQSVFWIRYLCLNFNNPNLAGRIFGQRYFREALQRSLDQDTAIRDIHHGHGYRTDGPVPALPPNELVSPKQRHDPMRFDPERARRLLEDNGWDVSTTPAVCVRGGVGPGRAGDGIEPGDRLTFSLRYVEGRPALTRLMAMFERDAAAVGIELRLEEVYGSILVAEDGPCVPSPECPCSWEMSCWNGGWVYWYPTGEVLFKTNAGGNFGHYSDPWADELIDRTVTTDDVEALYEYQDYIAEQVPVVWMPNFPLRLFEVANELRGFEPVNPFGFHNPENWYYVGDE